MILINPKIIRDISKNLNVNIFDMSIDNVNGGGGSPYDCAVNEDGSIILQIRNVHGSRVTLNFNGTKYVEIRCEDGRYKVFVMSRQREEYFELEDILRNRFNVNI